MKIKVLKAFAGFFYDSKGFKGGMVKLKVLKVLKARWEACFIHTRILKSQNEI